MQKKINIVTPIFPPYAGGIGNVAYHNAKVIQKRGYDVEVFVPNYDEKKTVSVNDKGVRIKRIKPMFTYGNAGFILSLKNYFQKNDIVHLHYPFFGGAEVLYFLKKRKKIRLIVHYHMDVVGKHFFKIIFYVYKKLFLPKILKISDQVIVTSYDYARHSDISSFVKKNPKKIIEIPNGVDTSIFTPQQKSKTILDRHGIQNEKVILFVGGLDQAHYFKGVENLIESVKDIDNVKLLIVGDGDLRTNYQKKVDDLGIHKKVIFAGKVSLEDLPKYFNVCDVCVLPSIDKSEAFGMVLVEAMACGKPVIASNLAGVRTVVDDGVTGFLVEPNDILGLRDKMKMILCDFELARMMGEAGMEKARQLYSWEVVGERLEEIYRKF